MDKQFAGFIKWKGNLTTITSKRDGKESTFRELIVSTDEQHPTSMVITFWGDLARQLEVAVPKQRISVDLDFSVVEFDKDGQKFFKNNIKGWRFALGAVDAQPNWVTPPAYQQPTQQAAAAAPQQAYQPASAPAPAAVPQQIPLQVNGLPNPVMLTPNQAPF